MQAALLMLAPHLGPRTEDGTPRTDFALSTEMGVTCSNSPNADWMLVQNVTRTGDNRLINQIPQDVSINWQLPLTDHTVTSLSPANDVHYAWGAQPTQTGSAQTLATIDSDIMVAVKPYSRGTYIYHSELAPLAGYSIYSPVAYEYAISAQAVDGLLKTKRPLGTVQCLRPTNTIPPS